MEHKTIYDLPLLTRPTAERMRRAEKNKEPIDGAELDPKHWRPGTEEHAAAVAAQQELVLRSLADLMNEAHERDMELKAALLEGQLQAEVMRRANLPIEQIRNRRRRDQSEPQRASTSGRVANPQVL